MISKAVEFLERVWSYQAKGNDDCYFFISTKSEATSNWKDHALKWPIKPGDIQRLLKKYNEEQFHVYFCPLPFNQPGRKREYVIGSRLLWADLDEAKPRQCDPIPQIAWESSPGRYSSLWLLNSFHSPLAIEPVNKALTHNSGADPGGWDLTQVLRIPYLRNRKYDELPRSKLMWFRKNEYGLDRVPAMKIDTLDPVKIYDKYKKLLKRSTIRTLGSKHATRGKRSEVIWKLENELAEAGLDESECFSLIKASVWNKFKGRNDEDIQLQREILKAAERRPKLAVLANPDDGKPEEKPKDATKNGFKYDGPLVRMDTIAPQSVDWLWFPYIPLGKFTLIEGDPSVGKSWLSLVIARHLSRRIQFPGTKKKVGGSVILMSAEDGLADTIRPRMDLLGVDPRKVFAVNEHLTLDEDGMEELERIIRDIRPLAVIIDPLVAYMGGHIDLHKANEIREMTAELASIAEEFGVAIIGVRHLRKGGADKAMYRGIGSIDLTAAARSVLIVGKNPNDQTQRAIVQVKNNLAAIGPTQTYAIEDLGEDVVPFRWTGEADLTAEDVLSAPKTEGGKSERIMAKEYLEEKVKGGRIRRDDLYRDAEARGIGKGALNNARKEMGIKETRRGKGVYWSYPQ